MDSRLSHQKNRTLPKISTFGANSLKYESPFAIPDDAQIFRMKDKEKDRKREQKLQNDKLKIWQKGVKKQQITIKELNELAPKYDNDDNSQTKVNLIEAAKNVIKNRVKVNEPMHDFISKKRETLLFQMLIDHKRQKINQFEEMTRLHKKGLQRAQQMLEQDKQAFNSYLNEKKKEARDAIKNAENQTRKKNEKIAYIKQKLQIQADLTGKNMSKRETLENLKKYKNFLDSLSPELSEEERNKKQQKLEQNENQNYASTLMDNLSSSSDEDEMYFKQPEQLMNIFHSLEESNLFLITNLKEIQQEIQQSRTSFNSKKQLLTRKKNQLLMHRTDMCKQIVQVDDEIDQLKKTTNKDDISEYFATLEKEIISLSKDIGFINDQKHVEALDLLKDVQRKIELQLRSLKQAKEEKPALIHTLEKVCFNEKREKKKLKYEEEMEEKALKQNIEASPEREKRKGRPIMLRSFLKNEKKHKEIEVVEPEEEIDKRKYLL